jgi:hypothetical protein
VLWLPLAVFEAPLAAAAVAGGAVSIPIIIHLLNRRRFRVVTWAAMRFLLAAQKKNSRRMRLEQLVLLGVRCLMVLLLVMAMASASGWAEGIWRWFSPNAALAVASTSQRTHKILVLDGSFSMGLRNAEGNCFERARALATQIVRESSGGDGFSVVLMAAPPRRIVPEPSEDGRKVIAEIDGLRLTHGNADLAATLSTVESLVQASPGKFPAKEVYFLTDLQQSTWIARQPALLSTTLQKIKDKAQTIFVDVGREGVNNLAVSSLTLGDSLATTARETPILATLSNYGETRDEVSVRLFIGRARDTAQDRGFELREVSETMVRQVKRGEPTPVAFKYKFPSPGEYVLLVQVVHDDLELDDLRSAVVTVKNTVPVMLVNGKPAVEAFDRASEWLRVALNPFDGGATPAIVPARPKVLSQSQFADEGLGDLMPFDCVFLCDVPRLSLAEVRRLESHVRRGGSAVFSLGDQVDIGAYNENLYRDGKGLLPARLISKQPAAPGYTYQLAIDPDADREDPLKPFRNPAAREHLLSARFQQFIQTEPVTRAGPRRILSFAAVAVPGKDASAVKSTPPPGGPAVLEWRPPVSPGQGGAKESGRLRGRVVLITTTVNSDWNSWPVSPAFPAFMQELLYFAASSRLREQVLQVGEPIELFLPGAGGGMEAVISTPDGRTETGRTQTLDEASVFRWIETDVSGIYSVVIGQHPQQHLFAVNVPAINEAQQLSESDLTRTTREELQKTYPEWEVQVVTEPGQVQHVPVANATPEYVLRPLGDVVARWLLLMVLVLIFVEVVLAWQFGHYSTVATASEDRSSPPARSLKSWAMLVLPWVLFGLVLGVAGVLAHDAWTGDFLGFLPEGMRGVAERFLDIPPPAPGEGSHWRLEYLAFLWDTRADLWLAPTLAVAALFLIYAVYVREGSQTLRRRDTVGRLIRLGLRMGLLFLMLAVILPRSRIWFERQGWPDVVILIDDSQSMSTVDTYRDTRLKTVAERLARHDGLTRADRLALAQSLVSRPYAVSGESSGDDWLTTLLTQRKVRVHVYHCSTRAHRLKDVHASEDVGPALEAVNALEASPQHDSSQLGVAVRQVLNDFRGSSLAAVVMLTDGVTTEGEDLVKVSKYAQQMGVPLFFVGIGDAQEVRDVFLHDLQVEDNVYVKDRVVFEFRITAQGYNRLSVPVFLHEKGKPRINDPNHHTIVEFDENHRTVKVRLMDEPTQPGEKIYEIEVPGQEEEVTVENNRLERPVFVNETRQIKVLYVEGYRRWEYHYIKTLLERESSRIKGNKSIDLKVLLMESDPDFPAEDRSAIAEFPPRAELNTFDVVLLGDVNPQSNADAKMMEHFKDLADFVRERGGGLLMIAGERYAPGAYKDTPLKDVLPIDILADKGADEGEKDFSESYRPELTPMGRMHPIFRFDPDEKSNEEIWDHLKEMYWYANGYQLKRAAEVLAVHPKSRGGGKRTDKTDKSRPNLENQPLVVQQFVGAGRSMFFGFDETWRWNFREDQLRFNQFWIQTVRYLARSRLGRIELRLDRQTAYRRGEPIKMTVRFPDDAPPPPADTEVKVLVERRNSARPGDTEVRTVQLPRLEGSRATFETLLTQTPEGEYKFWLSQPTAPNPKPHAECQVLRPPGEMERLRMNQTDMERATDESQGRFYTIADADHLLEDLPTGTRVTVNAPGPPYPVWNLFSVFLLAMLLLTTEWLLRKEKNLL